jgi:hypothetical protein
LRGIFSSDYKYIDTKNRVYNGKHYDVRSQEFFEIARKYQEKNGCSQTTAVNRIHDAFVVKDSIERTKKHPKELSDILEEYFIDDIDFDLGIDLIYDFYG